MVPGKKYAPEDFVLIAWRRRWLIVLPFIVFSAGAVLYSRSLPNLYKSETLILVMPQRVPQSYVASTVTTQIDQRLQSISQQVMSRTRLERIIEEFDLYPERRQNALMEDIVQRMRLDVTIDILRATRDAQSGTSFRVAYVSPDPLKAMRVTERLASMFIDANLKDRELLAEGTDQFIEAELIAARNRLDEYERALEEHRRQHPWDQAEQVDHNRWAIVNTQQWLENVNTSLKQNRDRLLFLERMVADLSTPDPELASGPAPAGARDTSVPQSAAAQLQSARESLRAMELRLKPEHPDVINAKRVIAELSRKAEQEALAAPVSADTPVAGVTPSHQRERLLNLRNEIDVLKGRIAEGEAEERQGQNLLAAQMKLVESYPMRARELQTLTRDYHTIRDNYHELLRKKQASTIAMNLERQQIGEQMRVVDPARLPQRPISPDRQRVNLLGAALGLGLGLGLAALFEYRDTSLRTEEDVLAALALPVVALVPMMRTTAEIRRWRRQRLLLSAAGTVMLVCCVAAVVWRTYGF